MDNRLLIGAGEKRKRDRDLDVDGFPYLDNPNHKKARMAPIICSDVASVQAALMEKQHFILDPSLTSLKLKKRHLLNVEQVTCLTKALRDGNRLESLDLTRCKLVPERLAPILQTLSGSRNITNLNIRGNFFAPELAKVIRYCPLQTLNLSDLGIGDDQLEEIVTEISSCPSLTCLSLAENSFTAHYADSCPGLILSQNSSIVKLNLSYNNLSTNCIERVARAIKLNGNLIEVRLTDAELKSEQAELLVDALSTCTDLKLLKLGEILLAVEDEVGLIKAIEQHNTLEHLHLSLGPKDGLVQFRNTLKQLNSLTFLRLHLFNTNEIQLVANLLRENNSIESVTIFASYWTSQSLKILKDQLVHNRCLKTIQILLSDDRLTPVGDAITPLILSIKEIADRNRQALQFDRSTLTLLIEQDDWPEIVKYIQTAQHTHNIGIEDILDPDLQSLQERIYFLTKYSKLCADEFNALESKKNISTSMLTKKEIECEELRWQAQELENKLNETKIKLYEAQNMQQEILQECTQLEHECEQSNKQCTSTQLLLSTLEEELAKIETLMQKDIAVWSVDDVVLLLTDLRLQEHCPVFQENSINGDILMRLTTLDLVQSGLNFKETKLLQRAIFTIQKYKNTTTVPAGVLRWNQAQVTTWLMKKNFAHLVDVFEAEQIEGGDLAFLDNYDLTHWLGIQSFVDKASLEACIKKLRDKLDGVGTNEAKQNAVAKKKAPNQFLCPITMQIMTDPVITVDGHTYERVAIEEWLSKHDTAPMTNQILSSKQLFPNHHLKSLIDDFHAGKT